MTPSRSTLSLQRRFPKYFMAFPCVLALDLATFSSPSVSSFFPPSPDQVACRDLPDFAPAPRSPLPPESCEIAAMNAVAKNFAASFGPPSALLLFFLKVVFRAHASHPYRLASPIPPLTPSPFYDSVRFFFFPLRSLSNIPPPVD